MKLPHALQIYLTVFVKKYAVAFFKVVQQQNIGEVGNSIMYLWAVHVFAKVMLKWKGCTASFFDFLKTFFDSFLECTPCPEKNVPLIFLL